MGDVQELEMDRDVVVQNLCLRAAEIVLVARMVVDGKEAQALSRLLATHSDLIDIVDVMRRLADS